MAAYVERGAAVDRAHRQMEQQRVSSLHPSLPHFEALRDAVERCRGVWRAWGDQWARGFNAACRAQGFLPPVGLRQRGVFDEVVRPYAAEPGITALVLVDALRFEMAQALFERIEGAAGTRARLRARLAELPSVTEVGMNVLAPVSCGGAAEVPGGPDPSPRGAGPPG